MTSTAALRELARLKDTFGRDAATRKRALLDRLAHATLHKAREVLLLHEALCFMRAYPDDRAVLTGTARMLAAFDRRADVRRHRRALIGHGIAGVPIHYRFFAPTASWLAARWPALLSIEWSEFEHADELERLLPLLVHPAETPGIDEYDLGTRGWIARLKAPEETDASFLIRRIAELPMEDLAREILYDGLDPPLVLAAGPDTPSRTREATKPPHPYFQRGPLSRTRPDLAAEVRRPPPGVRDLGPREGARWIDLARGAMAVRARDLDVFAYGDPRDVRMVDCDKGLELVMIGAIPERRLLLESVYGYLILRNRTPIGYALTGALFGSSEIAFNIFDTFRGHDAAAVYGRVLAATRRLFGADAFAISHYQLGDGNDEALASGAWWFYAKLGFRPRERSVARRANAELRRVAAFPGHRSSVGTLKRLASAPLFWFAGERRRDVMGELPLAEVGLRVTDEMARRFGSRRREAAETCAREASDLLGLPSLHGFSPGERMAWERWAPLVSMLPGLKRWTTAEKRALVDVIRAKGGRRESDFVTRFDRHARLRRALVTLARGRSRPIVGGATR